MSQPAETPKKNPYDVNPIPEDTRRGWTLEVDGEIITPTQFTLVNERFGGELVYGMRPEGYDGFVIRERGGSVTLPYTVSPDGQILVGLIDEYRPTNGESSTLNAPRGMANVGETSRRDTAARELFEETGYDPTSQEVGSAALELTELATDVNANSTYIDISRPENEGTAFFALNVPSDHLELRHDEDGALYYAFPEQTQKTAEDAATEKIFGSRFVPIHEALQSKDMFTGYAVGQLLGRLLEDGNYIVPQTKRDQLSEAAS